MLVAAVLEGFVGLDAKCVLNLATPYQNSEDNRMPMPDAVEHSGAKDASAKRLLNRARLLHSALTLHNTKALF